MSQYCWVDGGVVQMGPMALPQNFVHPVTGVTYTNLQLKSANDLLTIGWYPFRDEYPAKPDPYYSWVDPGVITVEATECVRYWGLDAWDIETVRAAKSAELDQQTPQYSGSDIAQDVDRDLLVKDIWEWTRGKKTQLAALNNDRATVVAFDTSLPDPIPLSNIYVGNRQARQGERILQEDQSRQGVNSPPLDPAVRANTETWQQENYAAADDATGATAPTEPPAEVRQMVNQPNEEKGSLTVVREFFDTPPWTGHGFRAIMIREDSNAIGFAVYNASQVYQYALTFQETSPNKWEVEQPPGNRWPSAEDFYYALLFGSNPVTGLVFMPSTVTEQSQEIRYSGSI